MYSSVSWIARMNNLRELKYGIVFGTEKYVHTEGIYDHKLMTRPQNGTVRLLLDNSDTLNLQDRLNRS
jgi:hypothetical protein